jgi:8-oxo-dGTP pyrophosphatase MutT (NUDIX family)
MSKSVGNVVSLRDAIEEWGRETLLLLFMGTHWRKPMDFSEETLAAAAAREVREETGVEGELVEKLGDIRYWYSHGGERVLKVVSFFLFRYRSGSVRDHDREVESAEWLPLEEAVERLSYKGEREMAAAALERLRIER